MKANVEFRHVYPDQKVKAFIDEKMKRLKRFVKNIAELDLHISSENHHFRSILVLNSNGQAHAFKADHANPYVAINELFVKAKRWVSEKKDRKVRNRKSIRLPIYDD